MEEDEEKVPKKKANNPTGKGGFTKEKPGLGRGVAPPLVRPGTDLVEDLRRAYGTDESPEDGAAIKGFRKMARDDPGRFADLFLKAQAAAEKERKDAVTSSPLSVTAAAAPAVEELTVGEKEERVLSLIKKLLAEWEKEDG